MSRKTLSSALLGFVCIVVGGWFLFTTRSEVSTARTEAGAKHANVEENSHALLIKPLFSRKAEPLLATAGSPAETYRAYSRCVGVTAETQVELQNDIAALKNGLNRVSPDLRADYEHAIQEKQEALSDQAICLTLGRPVTKEDVHKLLLAAAQSGDLPSQLRFARDPEIDTQQAIAHLDELRQWKELARKFVASAAANGNQDAILLEAEAGDPYGCQATVQGNCAGLYAEIVDDDPKVAYENYYLASLLDPGKIPSWVAVEMSALQTLLSQADLAKAKLQAEARRSSLLRQ